MLNSRISQVIVAIGIVVIIMLVALETYAPDGYNILWQLVVDYVVNTTLG